MLGHQSTIAPGWGLIFLAGTVCICCSLTVVGSMLDQRVCYRICALADIVAIVLWESAHWRKCGQLARVELSTAVRNVRWRTDTVRMAMIQG